MKLYFGFPFHRMLHSVMSATLLSGFFASCALVPRQASVTPPLSSLGSLQRAAHQVAHLAAHQPQRKGPGIRVTGVRDLDVRIEIHQELSELQSLSEARAKILQTYESKPLLGPLTTARMIEVAEAEYKANWLQEVYIEAAQTNQAAQSPPASQSTQAAVAQFLPAKKSKTTSASLNEQAQSILKSATPLAPKIAQGNTPGNMSVNAPGIAPVNGPQPLPESGSTVVQIAGVPNLLNDLAPELVEHGQVQAGRAPPAGRSFAQASLTPVGQSASKLLAQVAEPGLGLSAMPEAPAAVLKRLNSLEKSSMEFSSASETPLIFDIPVTYNARVSFWIHYFQTEGRSSFQRYLERSARFLPILQYELTRSGLPQDLVYVAMIESGFSPNASSHASAMGLWQFIEPTGRRYGLKIDWWIDERKDFLKSTRAAISYMTDLYRQFNSWYLVAASYNMGENGVRRLIQRHRTNNFWELADKGALPQETTNYVPKIIAATLISKAPALYGFRGLDYQMPLSFEYFNAPGGTDLVHLAQYLGVSEKYLKELNPELLHAMIPRHVGGHKIRIPKGSMTTVAQFVRMQGAAEVWK
jgi:membrane-bound lytic murein transglycosylase D